MKAVRIIGNILIGIILFGLIFALTFVRTTKNFLEKDVILNVIKEKITETVREESGKLSNKSEALIDDMLNDNDASDIIHMVLDNFDHYQENKTNYKVSDADIEKITSYANKYKSVIVELSGNKIKELSDEEFRKIFSSDNINSVANEIFDAIDGDVGEGIDIAIKIYDKATSNTVLIILISAIAFFILLLILINWSLYKWMITAGIALIMSGSLIALIYAVGLLFNDIIVSSETVKKMIGELNLTGYLVWGSIEIVVGILFITIYCFVKYKKDDTFKQLDNL